MSLDEGEEVTHSQEGGGYVRPGVADALRVVGPRAVGGGVEVPRAIVHTPLAGILYNTQPISTCNTHQQSLSLMYSNGNYS